MVCSDRVAASTSSGGGELWYTDSHASRTPSLRTGSAGSATYGGAALPSSP